MAKECSHSKTKVDTKTGQRPRHICLLCGLVLNSKTEIESKKKDAGNSKKEKS